MELAGRGAQFEHLIMCQYLYACFSLRTEPDEGLTAEQAEAVARWKETLTGLAIEEMLHLALAAAAPPGHQSWPGTPATWACRGTRTGAREKVAAQGSCAPAGPGAAAPCQVPGPGAAVVAAGNEVGITGARTCAVPLCSAQLCAGFTCGNLETPWWRG